MEKMNSTTINANFFNTVGEALLDALAEARLHAKEGEPVNGALCEFYLGALLRDCGAERVSFHLQQTENGYSIFRVKFSDGKFIETRDFFPRRKMTQAEFDSLGDIKPDDIIATAGIWEENENTHVSFKWDRLVVKGEEITFGPVRKWVNGQSESPIYDPETEVEETTEEKSE